MSILSFFLHCTSTTEIHTYRPTLPLHDALPFSWYVCCANGAARALFVGLFDAGDQPNLLDYVFTHPAARGLLPDWRARAARLLSEFRRDVGRGVTDPRVHMVVDRLCAISADFAGESDRQAVLTPYSSARPLDQPAPRPVQR